jgi:hypothetical protein
MGSKTRLETRVTRTSLVLFLFSLSFFLVLLLFCFDHWNRAYQGVLGSSHRLLATSGGVVMHRARRFR